MACLLDPSTDNTVRLSDLVYLMQNLRACGDEQVDEHEWARCWKLADALMVLVSARRCENVDL